MVKVLLLYLVLFTVYCAPNTTQNAVRIVSSEVGSVAKEYAVGDLYFGLINENSLEIFLDCTYPIKAFSFTISGADVIGWDGGAADLADFNVSIVDNIVSGESVRQWIPKNAGKLLNLNIKTTSNAEICFESSQIVTSYNEYQASMGECIKNIR